MSSSGRTSDYARMQLAHTGHGLRKALAHGIYHIKLRMCALLKTKHISTSKVRQIMNMLTFKR